ncbi:hypothetical protein ACVWXO_008102 [Bradyrhizobium sp. LM2.7]
MRDNTNRNNLKPAFLPGAAVTDNTVQTSQVADLLGYDSCMLAMVTGTLSDADAAFAVTVEESDDNSTFTAAAAADLIGTTALASFDFAADNVCRKIGYRGTKRYVRAKITPANNTGNLFVAGVWVLGHPNRQPTANPPS